MNKEPIAVIDEAKGVDLPYAKKPEAPSVSKADLGLCVVDDCLQLGNWHPVLVCRAKRGPAVRSHPLKILVCDKHRIKDARKFIHPQTWQSVVNQFARHGFRKPHLASTTIEYIAAKIPQTGMRQALEQAAELEGIRNDVISERSVDTEKEKAPDIRT